MHRLWDQSVITWYTNVTMGKSNNSWKNKSIWIWSALLFFYCVYYIILLFPFSMKFLSLLANEMNGNYVKRIFKLIALKADILGRDRRLISSRSFCCTWGYKPFVTWNTWSMYASVVTCCVPCTCKREIERNVSKSNKRKG